ncbi:MAG: RCC1 domain-containing protein, partial [Candidatus Longimicrobiales bacterium M2_2A_002]
TTDRSTPVQVMSDVAAVSAGGGHTMILRTDGTLWGTGLNAFGQLGDGTTADRTTPVQVTL